MRDVVDAPDAFEALAAELTGQRVAQRPLASGQLDLDDVPDWIRDKFFPGVNADLCLPTKLSDIEQAARAIPPETWRSYSNWRTLTFALAHQSVIAPGDTAALNALWHEVSGAKGAFEPTGPFVSGYDPSANDHFWPVTVADCERRIADGREVTTVATLLHMARPHMDPRADGEHRPVLQSNGADFQTDTPTALDITAFDFASQPAAPHKRRPLHGNDLFRGEITVLSAAGGSAKTTVACAMTCALATGQPLMGETPIRPLTVLLANIEDHRGETLMRLSAVMDHNSIARAALHQRVYVLGSEQAPELVLTETTPGNGRERVRRDGLCYLRALVQKTQADVVVLDPLVALIPYGLNDGGIMSMVATELKRIAEDFDCAILLVAHTRKNSNAQTDGADATAGSSQIINRARVGLGLVGMTSSEAAAYGVFPGEEWRYKQLVNTKANLSPIQGGRWIELVSVGAGNGTSEYPDEDHVAVAIPFVPMVNAPSWITAQMQRDALVSVAQGFNGVPLSAKSGPHPRAFTHSISATLSPHLPGKSAQELEAAAKSILADLQKRGWVISTTTPIAKSSGGTNPSTGLVAVWSATPWATSPAPGAFVQ